MPSPRNLVLNNGQIYHVFNRGVERRKIFTNKREYRRAQELIKFYRHKEIPIRYSKLMLQPLVIREEILKDLYKREKRVDILAYCFMPNHFHFVLRQNLDNGISKFTSDFSNAYTKYFNTRNSREGPLFQGIFKAVFIESDEQFMHVVRYVHINPVVSSLIKQEDLDKYSWSSYPEYLGLSDNSIAEKGSLLGMFKNVVGYKKFVNDQIGYAKELDSVKHLLIE